MEPNPYESPREGIEDARKSQLPKLLMKVGLIVVITAGILLNLFALGIAFSS